MKFTFVLLFSVLLTVSIGTAVRNYHSPPKETLISPLIAGENTSLLPVAPTGELFRGWQIFVNNYYGYKVKHPSDVNIKNKKDGDVSLQKTKTIDLSITQDVLAENDNLNTTIEKIIKTRKDESKSKFNLIKTISPISIGLVTAQTYTSIENGSSVSYYYIPQKDNKFLIVTNYSPYNSSSDYLTSEDIIFSLELFP
jgi:hypothetical protein